MGVKVGPLLEAMDVRPTRQTPQPCSRSLPLRLRRCQTRATRTRTKMSPELLEVLWTSSVHIPSSTIGQCANAFELVDRRFACAVLATGFGWFWSILARGDAAIYRGGFARRCRFRSCSATRTSTQMHALSSGTQSHTVHSLGSCALLLMHLCLRIVISTTNSSTTVG